MNNEKENRRVKYTKMAIKNSFLELLKEKSISKISVKEICDIADVNRSTFYNYYLDQYDLLSSVEEELISGITNHLDNYDFSDKSDAPIDMIKRILDYIQSEKDIFNIFFNSSDLFFVEKIIKIIGKQYILSTYQNYSLTKIEAEYYFSFVGFGTIGVIQLWLRNGAKTNTNDLAKIIFKNSKIER